MLSTNQKLLRWAKRGLEERYFWTILKRFGNNGAGIRRWTEYWV